MSITPLPSLSLSPIATRRRERDGDCPPAAPRRANAGSLLPVVGQELRVPLVGGGEARYANLDYGATAPALATVAERVTRVLPYYGSVHRGSGLPARVSTALYEQSRQALARFLGARADDEVIFTRNTTDALNLLAGAVPEGAGDVLFLDSEHHANLLPWRRRAHRAVAFAPTLELTLGRLRDALAAGPVALVAITGASNVTGELLPLERIVALAHGAGARVVVDAAQLAPHVRVDLEALGADYIALSGHKLYAPYGAGALVGRRDWLDAAAPHLAGGGAVREVTWEGTEWHDGPARHEGGTPNLLGAVAIAEACNTLDALPAGALEAHDHSLRELLLARLERLDAVRVARIWADSSAAIGTVAFAVEGYAPAHVGAYLSAEHGVGVRDGRFCAHQLLGRLGLPGGALRASFGVGTSADDVERLAEAVERLVREGARRDYAPGPDGWAPVGDDRPLPDLLA
ncbi:aminotransferase class V-fold PLP-dependent enzyme [Conexibacter stalactiti]|uniref:Aminotransferase class V-fold PLP-dependent enzyme n=1 Tax=Conexibacter stalactiti TaxID=1940611 RepID=A0ABU4HHE0_9ACTN|nr:aminotransferase class V-fold PLP-dependent enzyme [Conexibacter stalactiti]MDW5592731.1 aminotransferase class V-fold PLP-dependent enzyme [Conexibacter stalactiti]MEC5033372.1 aminotransferase class V-fold PLP-dependent enzyme [Conexibacter stalactiti]